MIRRIKKILELYFKNEEQSKYADGMDKKINVLGFVDGKTAGILGSPMRDIGTALRLIEHYKLEMNVGTCYGDCVVYLDRQNWKYPLDEAVSQFSYGVWRERKHDDISSIYAYSSSLNDAICKCLINCRQAGVL